MWNIEEGIEWKILGKCLLKICVENKISSGFLNGIYDNFMKYYWINN